MIRERVTKMERASSESSRSRYRLPEVRRRQLVQNRREEDHLALLRARRHAGHANDVPTLEEFVRADERVRIRGVPGGTVSVGYFAFGAATHWRVTMIWTFLPSACRS
jgi:hypothetical protein